MTEVNLSGTDYGTPIFSGSCSQNGLSGAVSLNAGDEKNCIVSNSFAYVEPQHQQSACNGGCVPACAGGCQPGLPNTGFGGSYLPIMNMIGIMILTGFVWQETRYGRASI